MLGGLSGRKGVKDGACRLRLRAWLLPRGTQGAVRVGGWGTEKAMPTSWKLHFWTLKVGFCPKRTARTSSMASISVHPKNCFGFPLLSWTRSALSTGTCLQLNRHHSLLLVCVVTGDWEERWSTYQHGTCLQPAIPFLPPRPALEHNGLGVRCYLRWQWGVRGWVFQEETLRLNWECKIFIRG